MARIHCRLHPLLLRELRHPQRRPPRPLLHHDLQVLSPRMPAQVLRLERQCGSLDAVVEASRSPPSAVSIVPWFWGRQVPEPPPAKPIPGGQHSHSMGIAA